MLVIIESKLSKIVAIIWYYLFYFNLFSISLHINQKLYLSTTPSIKPNNLSIFINIMSFFNINPIILFI
jgi:hypothetical protein